MSSRSLRPDSVWQFSLYPDAGEGGGQYGRVIRKHVPYVRRGDAADPERAAVEAGRRARRNLRRYCAANGLTRLGTLTYGGDGCHDPQQLRADLGEFFRALRDGLGGEPLPYAWVPEWHKTHGLHAHFALGRYVGRKLIEAAWGRGFIHITLLGDLPVGAGTLEQARRAAGYLSKYVSKSFTDDRGHELGLHRYDVAQGFRPKAVTLTGETSIDVLDQASAVLGSNPIRLWSSRDQENWQGPPSLWAQWGQ